jgi:hypothetical protein
MFVEKAAHLWPRMRFRSFGNVAAALVVSLTSFLAKAEDGRRIEPPVTVTWPWLLAQVVPSPELVFGQSTTRFGMRWQATPLLFSWGVHRGLSPWRLFVVEPNVRHFGSVELYVTPEVVGAEDDVEGAWIFRSGARAYFPLVEHGEYLSCSVGASQFFYNAQSAAGYEAGLYTFFGVLGLQVTVSPRFAPMATSVTLSVRYF